MKEIRIIAESRKTKEGRTFTAFKGVQKNGKLIDVKFTKAVRQVPEKSCTIVVKAENANVDKTTLYPVLWVKAIEEIKYLEQTSAERNKATLDDLF